MRRKVRTALLAATIAASGGALVPATALPGNTTRISQPPARPQPNGPSPASSVPDTTSPALALAGTMVAFSSDASNIVSGDTNGAADVFLRDIATGKTRRVSVNSSGAQLNGASYSPSLSVDGRYIAFVSAATNVAAGDTNGVADVFYRDLQTGATSRISVATSGSQANGPSNTPFVSLFGDYVTFESTASTLSAGDTNGFSDSFLREIKKNKTTRIVAPALTQDLEQQPEISWTEHAEISFDGHFLAYARGATRTSTDRPTLFDAYVLDRWTGRQRNLDVAAWAGAFKSMNAETTISADGRYVAFTAWSVADNDHTVGRGLQQPSPVRNDDAIARNSADVKDVWIYDQTSKATIPVSTNPKGPIGDGDSYDPAISANGHAVTFTSDATNLVAGDTNGRSDVFVKDLEQRTTARVSLAGPGGEANGASARPSLSYEGRRVVFASDATNLDPTDSNAASDLFMRDRRIDTTNRAPHMTPQGDKVRGLNLLESTTLHLKATDPDGDPLRFGAIAGMPNGVTMGVPDKATLDPLTGEFDWTPGPQADTNQKTAANSFVGGRDVWIIFWVEDPRGASDYILVKYFVRDIQQSLRCRTLEHACYP